MDLGRQTELPDNRNLHPLRPTLLAATGTYLYTQDRQTFAELYESYKEPLTKHLKALVNDRETAYDLCQDTFVRMWKHFSHPNTVKAEVIEYFAPQIYTIARHIAFDYIRHKSKIMFLPLPEGDQYTSDAMLLSGQFSTAGHEQQICEQMLIEQVFAAMSSQYRVCLLLQTKWGLTQQEIALALGIGIKAVSTNVSRGNKQFREIYAKLMDDCHTNSTGGSKRHGRFNLLSF